MSDHGYEVFDDPYCYRGTFVLKNRAGLFRARRLHHWVRVNSKT